MWYGWAIQTIMLYTRDQCIVLHSDMQQQIQQMFWGICRQLGTHVYQFIPQVCYPAIKWVLGFTNTEVLNMHAYLQCHSNLNKPFHHLSFLQ